MGTAPPGSAGLPLLGEVLELFRDPIGFTGRRVARHGSFVFRTQVTRWPAYALASAEAQEVVLRRQYRDFPWGDGYGLMGDEIFHQSLFLLDDDPHDRIRRLMNPAFHGREHAGYLDGMNAAIDRRLALWGERGMRPMFAEAHAIAFDMATSVLVGLTPSVDVQRMQALFERMMAGTTTANHLHIPWTKYGRALVAKDALEVILRRFVAERRADPRTDILGRLVAARDESGDVFTDDELVAQAKVLIFASHSSTTATLTWLMLELLRHPAAFERARAEAGDGDLHTPVTLTDLRGMPYLDAVIRETLRLHPAVSFMMRGARQPFAIDGYDIPQGALILLIPAYTHRRLDYFTYPDSFDPERFLPPREEQKLHPYAWIGFGDGPRICIGERIAFLEMKSLLVKLLRGYDLALVAGEDYTPQYLPTNHPKSLVPIHYRRRHAIMHPM